MFELLGPLHTGEFSFESRAKFPETKFPKIFFHKIEHGLSLQE